MKKYAVIVAGGSGTRMGSAVPKQFILVHGKPVVWHTVNKFLEAFDDLEIILVVPTAYEDTARAVILTLNQPDRVKIVSGGDSRFQSVKNGLDHIDHPSIVLVHDAVRCLLSTDLIHRCYQIALQQGNAVPAVVAVDSIRIANKHGNESVSRTEVRLIQTPQTFHSEIIAKAFEQDYDPTFTDEATLVERMGIAINLVEGETTNIKLTTPIDLYLAEKVLQQSS